MTYDFTLDKKAMFSLIAGSVVLGVLLFAAGWVGRLCWTSDSTTAAAASPTTAKPGTDQAALPKEPVLNEDPPEADIAGPTRSVEPPKQEVAPPKAMTGSSTSQAGAPESVVALAQPESTMDQSQNRQTEQAHPADTRGNVDLDAAEASALPVKGDNAAGQSRSFTVQVGVFLDQQEASRLIKAMESKGYSPSFFADRDAENRQWYAVRIGAYTDKNQAAVAAANFSKQEMIRAVVRPLGSL